MNVDRHRRVGTYETRFRDVNERLRQGLARVPHLPELLEFVCECGQQHCERMVLASLAEYEAVRGDSRRFVVVPGHELLDTERVVAGNDRYTVVEKLGVAAEPDGPSRDAG